ncbi:MAG: hypothetical protein NC131_15075, partial [Roseburia sp.]|nr:hypothetical protein [Roseburia sp.]
MLSKRQMETAVQWWGEKVRGGATHNNGADSIQSFMAMMMADSMVKTQDSEKVEKFKSLLREAFYNTDYSFRTHDLIRLSCDYGPDYILAECAEKAGIDTMNFPWKTTMNFNDGGVQVSEGYGAPYENLELVKASLNKNDILRMIKYCHEHSLPLIDDESQSLYFKYAYDYAEFKKLFRDANLPVIVSKEENNQT